MTWQELKAFFDGRKTIIGALLVAAPVVIGEIRDLAVALGLDPTIAATWVGSALLFVGLVHKAWKTFVALESVTTTVTVTTPLPEVRPTPPTETTVTVTTEPTEEAK